MTEILTREGAGVDPAPVVPAPDPLTDFFWEAARQGRLEILRCDNCGWYVHWPRAICRRCQSFSLTAREVSGSATLYSWTVGVQAFDPWFANRLPYILAVVELAEQPNLKMVTNLVDCAEDEVEIGMALEVAFERISEDYTLPVFRPAGSDRTGRA
jgi:uncharacterized OB-fold protein